MLVSIFLAMAIGAICDLYFTSKAIVKFTDNEADDEKVIDWMVTRTSWTDFIKQIDITVGLWMGLFTFRGFALKYYCEEDERQEPQKS